MKILKFFKGLFIFLFVICEMAIESNMWFGVIGVLFLVAFMLLNKLEENTNDREESHNRYLNRKHKFNNDVTYTTYTSRGNERYME